MILYYIFVLFVLFYSNKGFIADTTGSYKPAFYTAGAMILLLSFFLPFLQYYFKPWRTLEMEGQLTQISSTETREKEDVSRRYQSGEDEERVALVQRDDQSIIKYNEAEKSKWMKIQWIHGSRRSLTSFFRS